jgi:hypothetical protein
MKNMGRMGESEGRGLGAPERTENRRGSRPQSTRGVKRRSQGAETSMGWPEMHMARTGRFHKVAKSLSYYSGHEPQDVPSGFDRRSMAHSGAEFALPFLPCQLCPLWPPAIKSNKQKSQADNHHDPSYQTRTRSHLKLIKFCPARPIMKRNVNTSQGACEDYSNTTQSYQPKTKYRRRSHSSIRSWVGL